jgi:outer membrane protein, multidrug efflux system
MAAKGRSLARLGVLLALAGCTVGPDFTPPQPAVPDRFTEQPAPKPAADADDAWWRTLHDPVLDRLIAEACAGSPDLEIAEARVREARAERAFAAAEDDPTINADASAARQHGSGNVPVGTPPGGTGRNVGSNLWLAGFDAGWEIDIFGGVRRAIESAEASLGNAIENRHDAELTLIAEVARDYVELRGAQRRLAIARQILDERRDVRGLVAAQFKSGLVGSLDMKRADSELAASEAEIPGLEAEERTDIYRLGVLVGKPPEGLVGTLDPVAPIPDARDPVPAGMPSDLLKRRPDIRAAEKRIAAANARIGVAEADLYPHFALTGVAGLESLNAGELFTTQSHYFAIGPSVSWLVFDAGRVRDRMAAEQARTDQAAADYRKTVLAALGEVETALISYGRQQLRRDALAREVAADRDSLDLAKRLYAQGLQDFLAVLDAERSLHASEIELADAQRDCALALIALNKALGGGWSTGGDAGQPQPAVQG